MSPVSTTSLHGPPVTIFGGTGLSMARRYVASIWSGPEPMASARRERLAWRLVSTGNFVPFMRSQISTGRRLPSRSSLTTSAVSSYAGSSSFEITTISSGLLRLSRSRYAGRS